MYTLSVKNEKNQILDITASAAYDILSINGLAPVSASIDLADAAGYDGALYSGGRVGTRNIVIRLSIHENVESNRIALYQFFKPKENIRIYYKNSTRDVYIDGYVESFECDFFTISQECQISVICPDPYFKQKDEIEITRQETISLFEFPFEVPLNVGIEFSEASEGYRADIMGGDVASGIIIEITASQSYGSALKPNTLTISNSTTGKRMVISDVWLASGQKLHINTFKGYKQIYSNRNGKIINEIKYLSKESQWIDIQPGNNIITLTDNSSELYKLKGICQAFRYYEGV